jgi:hypothetical protein
MFSLIKWKKVLFSTLAIGIISWSIHGIYHTANAYENIRQSQTSSDTLTSNSTYGQDSPAPDGAFCNPHGCVGCRGCASLLYQQNIEALPSSDVRVVQID